MHIVDKVSGEFLVEVIKSLFLFTPFISSSESLDSSITPLCDTGRFGSD